MAGAAVLVKDWFLANGYTSISIEGRLFAVLLAMTDRADGTYPDTVSSGFRPRWGGGRFQARMLNAADLGGPWGWESWSTVISDGQQADHVMFGSGNEPAGLSQFKAYGVFFENNNIDIADIDMSVMTGNCSGSVLRSDQGYDNKLMVRTTTAGQALCVRRIGVEVPVEGRRVHHFAYYSGGTSMR